MNSQIFLQNIKAYNTTFINENIELNVTTLISVCLKLILFIYFTKYFLTSES